MGKTNRYHVGTIETKPSDHVKDRGHEYGKGRTVKVHKHKGSKRERQKLRNQLKDFY